MNTFQEHNKAMAWVLPKATDRMEAVFKRLGTKEFFDADEVVLYPRNAASKLYLIERGALSQAVVNFNASKQFAMNIYFENTVNGIINLFTGHRMPRLVRRWSRPPASASKDRRSWIT